MKTPPDAARWRQGLFTAALGLWLGLALLKFGNPVVLDAQVKTPENLEEMIVAAWPVAWGYGLGMVGLVLGIFSGPWMRPRWSVLLFAPLVWLVWQFVAGTQTLNAALTGATLRHFTACVACFYLGYFALSRSRVLWPLWTGLVAGFAIVLAVGWEQHFVGLERTRKFFYEQPDWQTYPPELLRKLASSRIYSTLFYPNTLAGVILLLLPVSLVFAWQMNREKFEAGARWLLVVLLGVAALACLYWSQSKAGWLIALLLGGVALGRSPVSGRWKRTVLVGLLVFGLAGFALKYAGYFEKGATSAGARFDYWRAALHIWKENPVVGTGPGTFSIAYRAIKSPESEMARLTHNDYLEQASDSGTVGFAGYLCLVLGTMVFAWRRSLPGGDWLKFSVWLGLLGWSVQGLVEFGLYVPALAWPAFLLLGWLLAAPVNRIDKQPEPATLAPGK